ncbi:MAG: carbamoyltransferase [Chlorobi bacterium]|nr:carbamoyltransferase [Chlorobiota bacterium]
MYILGISAYYHDSAAVLIKDDFIIAAVQEERFSRKKHDPDFPIKSIEYCLKEANITLPEIDNIVFYDKPFIKFERILLTYIAEAPKGFKSFQEAMPIWLKEKLFLKSTIVNELRSIEKLSKKDLRKKIMFSEHHIAHASSAFFPSPFEDAVIVTIDGVGEWTTTSIAYGKNNKIEILKEIHFPHSLGLLYSAFTYYCGFKVNSGEYKLMGLAPYGQPKYIDKIRDYLVTINEDGSFALDMDYFNYTTGLTMTNDKFHRLFGRPPRKSESEIDEFYMDVAKSIQVVTEEIIINIVKYAKKLTGSKNLCLAGGVALNCVANGKILEKNIFDDIWIQPAASDAGGALGAAFACYFMEYNKPRIIDNNNDKMQGALLGPQFTNDDIKNILDKFKVSAKKVNNDELFERVADALINQKVIGWFQGRMEYGPRALGNRSIIGDPRSQKMQSIINQKIKFREDFRPFAPSILLEKTKEFFEFDKSSPYMLFIANVSKQKRIMLSEVEKKLNGLDKLIIAKSIIPAVTHVDYTARLQTVDSRTNPRYYNLIDKFYEKTDCPLVINTSFNVRGEPIVCTPEEAYHCFMRTEMDILVMGNYIIYKKTMD